MKADYILLWPVLLGQVGANPIALEATHSGSTTTAKANNVKAKSETSTSSTKTNTNAASTATSSWRFQHSGDWVNIPCNGKDTDITVGTFMDKWNSAKVPTAWAQLFNDFKTYRDQDENKAGGGGPVRLDSYLWNAFSINTDPQCSVHDAPCAPPECGKNQFPAAAEYILSSFSYLHQAITTVWDSVITNQIISQGDMSNFVQSFAERKDTTDEKTIKLILDSITFVLGLGSAVVWNDILKEAKVFPQYLNKAKGQRFPKNGKAPEGAKSSEGNSRSVWKDVSSASIAYAMINGKDSLSTPVDAITEITGKMAWYASSYFNSTIIGIQNQLTDIMWANDTKNRDKIDQMMEGGGMFNMSGLTDSSWSDLQFDLKSLFWGSMLPEVWENSEEPMNPFILRLGPEHWKCGDDVQVGGGTALKVSSWNPGRYMNPGTNVGTHWCDNSDLSKSATFWLLNANYPKCKSCINNDWQPFTVLKGGDNVTLDGERWGLSLEDVIASSYGGFLKNGKRNGYSLQSGDSVVVDEDWDLIDYGWPMLGNVQTPGFFNFTICLDPAEAKANILNLVHPPCGAQPKDVEDVSGGENSDGYVPGWCTIHITQFQPDQYKQGTHEEFEYINPLNEYQLAVTVMGGDNAPLVYATKQPVDGSLEIDSKLPYPVIVQDNYKGSDGKDMLSFWYNNQWWLETDQQHHCNIGAFDNGKREGSCGFTCNNPDQDPKKDPPRATPANPVKAFEGTGTPQSFGNAKDYKKGKCELHIRQYQQNEMTNDLNAGTYALELTLYDNEAALIAYTEKTNRAGGDTKNTVNIQGPLEWLITCYSAKNDSTSPTCKYGAQDLTPSHEDFKNGLRDFGVKFDC